MSHLHTMERRDGAKVTGKKCCNLLARRTLYWLRARMDRQSIDGQSMTIVDQRSLTDEEIIERVLQGESALYELLVRRYNQKLYRAIRAVLKDDSEAEDVMQEAYVRAFQKLRQFEGRASFSTWVTRI